MGFIEQINKRNIDFSQEICSIESLMSERKQYYSGVGDYGSFTIYAIMERLFRSWELRGTFISLDQMKAKMGIDSILCRCAYLDENGSIASPDIIGYNGDASEDDYTFYTEFIYNILYCIDEARKRTSQHTINLSLILESAQAIEITIKQNIAYILDRLGLRWFFSEQGFEWKIVKKDFIVEVSAAIAGAYEKNLSENIILYTHSKIHGNLVEKNKILFLLAKHFEKEVISNLKKHSYNDLLSDIGFLANNCDVRHCVEDNRKVGRERQEENYDILFKLYLSAIIINDYIKTKPFVNKLKSEIANTKKVVPT